MGERNMVCASPIVDMEIDQQGQDHLHPEPCFYLGNNAHYPHPNIYPMISTSGNASNMDLRHFPNNRGSSVFYGSQFNGLQHHNPVTNMDVGASSSFSMVPPGGRVFPIPHVSSDQLPSASQHGIVGVGLNEFGVNHHFMDGVRSSGKRKNAEAVPGIYHQVNGSASSSSSSLGMPPLNTGLLQTEEHLEPGAGMLNAAAASIPLEYRVNGVPPITGGRSGRSVRSRSNTLGLQMEPPVMHNTNHLVQGNYMGQSFQPATWLEQRFASAGNDGSTSNWNYAPAIPYVNGPTINGVSSEIASMGAQGYSEMMNNRNSTMVLNPPVPHHQHFHPSPPAMQAMHVPTNYHLQPFVPSFRHPTSNTLHHGALNHSLDDSEVGARPSRPFLSNGIRMYRPHRSGFHPMAPANNNRPHLRFLSEDEVAILEFPGFYEVGSSVDRHRDMRLDIDDMSYEELLALGERIGNVVTGLPEETIASRLKTKIYTSSVTEETNSDNETCIVCQVEYSNQEKVGTLDCGHEYHVDCIKRWLQVKNVCPICKVPAINVEDGQKAK